MVDPREARPVFTLNTTDSAFHLSRIGTEFEIVINRISKNITFEGKQNTPSGEERLIYSIFGIATLSASKYLILISQATPVCKIRDSLIYRIDQIEFLPYLSPSTLASSTSKPVDDHFISLYNELIDTKLFYFSYEYDLTHSLQTLLTSSMEFHSNPLWQRANPSYFWNRHACEELVEAQAHDFIVPVINGYVASQKLILQNVEIDYVLLSRRDHRRTGTRFNTRGLNKQGHAVNFAETEQIVLQRKGTNWVISSFVQVRGSIPLLWEQKPTLEWNPRMRVKGTTQENIDTAQLHFEEMKLKYGEVTIVNLIDKKGNQKELGVIFTDLIDTLGDRDLQYVWFDFHAECKKMKWENLSKLLDIVDEYINRQSYFQATVQDAKPWHTSVVTMRQNGVLRTNCIDCLDRTNVVQSVFARNILLKTLNSLGLTSPPTGEAFQKLPEPLETFFRNMWVFNADAMSILYAGTPALKTDFTRTGKRSYKGAVDDGMNSLQRYVKNNFLDGRRQDAMDAILGRLTPKTNQVHINGRFKSLCTVLLLMGFGFATGHMCASATGEGWGYISVLAMSVGLFTSLIKNNGRLIVDKPSLSN
jgi:hypothetical protein